MAQFYFENALLQKKYVCIHMYVVLEDGVCEVIILHKQPCEEEMPVNTVGYPPPCGGSEITAGVSGCCGL